MTPDHVHREETCLSQRDQALLGVVTLRYAATRDFDATDDLRQVIRRLDMNFDGWSWLAREARRLASEQPEWHDFADEIERKRYVGLS